MRLAYEQQTHFRSSLLEGRNASAVRRLPKGLSKNFLRQQPWFRFLATVCLSLYSSKQFIIKQLLDEVLVIS